MNQLKPSTVVSEFLAGRDARCGSLRSECGGLFIVEPLHRTTIAIRCLEPPQQDLDDPIPNKVFHPPIRLIQEHCCETLGQATIRAMVERLASEWGIPIKPTTRILP